MSIVIGALEQGLIFAVMAVGIFISFRVLDIPDLTIDGSFTLGMACSGVLAAAGHPWLGIFVSILAGGLAGCVTGFLQTKMKIQYILAGILTMTALYSINLRIMGKKPNIPLFDKDSIFDIFPALPDSVRFIAVSLLILTIICVLLYFFLKTQLGMSLRATGDNEQMVRASSINSDRMKILGLAISNGLVSLSAAMLAQYQQYSDANAGTGMMVVGIASIIIGETLIGRKTIVRNILAAAFGSVVYRFILSGAMQIGMEAIDFKLFSALIVAVALCVPMIRQAVEKHIKRRNSDA